MMLGKRARPPMQRTASMTEFTLDFNGGAEGVYRPTSDSQNPFNGGAGELDQRFSASATAASPRQQRRNSADVGQTSHFLSACSLCKRLLIPGRDIYMYRGDSAFCSLECRQHRMTQDEREDKCSFVSSAGTQVSATG